ncbi:MAG TPA: hypothetical protein VL495_08830 [Edaphobacter sp.]|nr:hypothetical protein [Edaphobacter sp.]
MIRGFGVNPISLCKPPAVVEGNPFGLARALSPQDKSDLISFLKTL